MSNFRDATNSKTYSIPARIVQRIFRGYHDRLAVQLWNGESISFGDGAPEATLLFRDQKAFRDLVLSRDPLALAEAYFKGALDMEGDIYQVLGLKDHLQSLALTMSEKLTFLLGALSTAGASSASGAVLTKNFSWPLIHRIGHSKRMNRKAIAYHYDVSNAFYELWLDEQMVYSCAYFESPADTLDQAQRNKLEHICRKLRLRPGERLLDIGCGWGALVRWAAQHYGVHAHGITLSHEQYEYNQAKIKQAGLEEQVTVEFMDYRDLPGEGTYDKIVSVGMFEHVGLKNLPTYFGIARRLLKPSGLFLNHGITHDKEDWGTSLDERFMNRYVFPDGELDTVGNVQRAMENAGFELVDVEALRQHYALTLRHWVNRLEQKRSEALQHVTEATYRIWRLYMAACALQFEQGDIGVYQILASGRNRMPANIPLTRRDLYC